MGSNKTFKIDDKKIRTYCAGDFGLIEAQVFEEKNGKSHLYSSQIFDLPHGKYWAFTHSVHNDDGMVYYKHTEDINYSSAKVQEKWEFLKKIALLREIIEKAKIENLEIV